MGVSDWRFGELDSVCAAAFSVLCPAGLSFGYA